VSIELDIWEVRRMLEVPIRENIAVWKAQGADLPERLAEMIAESLYICAATTQRQTPELGIKSGLSMVRAWKDNRE